MSNLDFKPNASTTVPVFLSPAHIELILESLKDFSATDMALKEDISRRLRIIKNSIKRKIERKINLEFTRYAKESK